MTASSFIGDGSNLTNIQAGQVQGNSIFVQGMIIMWNSTVASIPTGFVLCDGNNGTPDFNLDLLLVKIIPVMVIT